MANTGEGLLMFIKYTSIALDMSVVDCNAPQHCLYNLLRMMETFMFSQKLGLLEYLAVNSGTADEF